MKALITTLNSKFIHSSLSIRYLKSHCKNYIKDITVQEYTINQNVDFIAGEIFKQKADVIAFSCYIWNIKNILEIAKILKIVNPNLIIILGGPEVSFDCEKILKKYDFINFIIYGEGEETFKELLIKLNKGFKEFNDIRGIAYRDIKHQKIIKNPLRPLICNLDTINTPFNDNLDVYKNKIVYYESSRGCPFNCKFCLSSTISGVRFFSLERVKKDLSLLISAGVKQVKFVDRTFNSKKDYALEIMKYLIEETKKSKSLINFHFEVTAHLLHKDILDFLETVPEGLFQFEIGIQSTNPKTIKAINRTTNIDKISQVVKKIKSYKNIHQHLDLIAGLPYEDYNTFRKSFNDVYNMDGDKLQLGFLKLLKGSELRTNKDDFGYKFADTPPYEVLENSYISYDEILRLKIIEELVEGYGNKAAFRNTIKFIITNFYNSPIDFYEEFSIYWESKEYHIRHHSEKGLYKKIFEFYNDKVSINMEVFTEILKFDFLYNSNNSNLPNYLQSFDYKDIQTKRHVFLQNEDNILKYLSNYKESSVKKIIKDIHFEKFKINILELIKMNYDISCVKKLETVILFEYTPQKPLNKCNVVDVTKEFYHIKE